MQFIYQAERNHSQLLSFKNSQNIVLQEISIKYQDILLFRHFQVVKT